MFQTFYFRKITKISIENSYYRNHVCYKLKDFSVDLQCWITGSLNNRQIFNIYYHGQRGYNIGEMELMLFIYLYSNSSLDNIPVALTTTSFWLKLSITTFMASSLVITNLNKIKISIKKIFFFFSYIKMNITYNFYLNDPYFTSMHLKNTILCFDVFRSDLHFIV